MKQTLAALVLACFLCAAALASTHGQGPNQPQGQGQQQQGQGQQTKDQNQQKPQQQTQQKEEKKEPTPQQKDWAKLLELYEKAKKANTDFALGGCGDKDKVTKLKKDAEAANAALDRAIDRYMDDYPSDAWSQVKEEFSNFPLPGKSAEQSEKEYKEARTKERERIKGELSEGKPLTLRVVSGCPGFAAFVSTDGGIWCTYAGGVATLIALAPTDDRGTPITANVPGTPVSTAGTPPMGSVTAPSAPVSDKPPATPLAPPDTPLPAKPPTTSDQPQPPVASDKPSPPAPASPPSGTTEVPPAIPDTVFVKASEAVLEGGQTGSELQNQTVKLIFAKPDLPGGGASKSAQDAGFDRDPAQCTTGANGECKLQVEPQDRAIYGLAKGDGKPGNYRLDLNLLKHNGAVAETTGKAAPDLSKAVPAGTKLTATEFRIGDRKFTRLGIDQPYGRSDDVAVYGGVLGAAAETDYCRTKKPGPALGMQPRTFAALNRELPEAIVKFDRLRRAGRAVR
jgi:hypothetical protein